MITEVNETGRPLKLNMKYGAEITGSVMGVVLLTGGLISTPSFDLVQEKNRTESRKGKNTFIAYFLYS